jgi:hypothetical protein
MDVGLLYWLTHIMADSLEDFEISTVALLARLISVTEVFNLQGQPAQWLTAGYKTEENITLFGTMSSSSSQGRISHKANTGHGLGRSSRGGGAYIQKYSIEVEF